MRDGCRGCGVDRVEPLGEERADHSRQDVARPGRGERGWPRVADDRLPVGCAHDRVGALQQNDRPEALRGASRRLEPVRADPRGLDVE